jgi:hypothetical protein
MTATMHKCHSIIITGKVQDISFRNTVEHIGRSFDLPDGFTKVSWVVPSSGTYFFKYDNSFSALTSKIVKTTITVTR